MVLESHIGVYMSIAPETVYGTFTETSQIFVPLLSETLTQDVERLIRDQEMTGSNRWERKPFQGRIKPARGVVRGYFYLDDLAGYWLRACFGAAASSTISGSAYKHVWYPGATQNNSLSIGVRRGGNSTEWRFAGCKIVSFKWILANQDMMIYEADIIAQQYTTGDTDSVTGLGTLIPPRFWEATLTDNAGSAQAIVSWDFSIDFGLNIDESKLFKWGGQTIIEPTAGGGVLKPRGNVTVNFDSSDDHAIYAAYRALTEYDRLCTFITTQTIPSGGGNFYRLNIDCPVAIINEYTPPNYNGIGIRQHSHVYDAYEGTSDNSNTTPVEIVLHNATASYA